MTQDLWHEGRPKALTLFGMSGLGKTHIAKLLRHDAGWFHYSIDYRIATRYMGALIEDDLKEQAMALPKLRELLLLDAITVRSKVSFDNLAPMSAYLGKPGDSAKNGFAYDAYMARQEQFRQAEVAALMDTGHFKARAKTLYNNPFFVCDTGGSVCEHVDPEDPSDPILTHLAAHSVLVWIKGDDSHVDALIERFNKAPKPMYYPPAYLAKRWATYGAQVEPNPAKVDPDHFVRWVYADAIKMRQPKYAAMAKHWGVAIGAADLANCAHPQDVLDLVKAAHDA